ncbi:hypothetical protein Dimus_018017 [Dionaea muscipula]
MENESQVHDYMVSQFDINEKMRAILVDWLIEVHNKFDLMPKTLYLTVNLVDCFLAAKMVPRREIQLLGISAMLIACKYEEIWAPEVDDFVCISDRVYTDEQILRMEKIIMHHLKGLSPASYIRCRHIRIGGGLVKGISGGERKRTSIGYEILVDPSLLLLDEPTSGLDSTSANRLLQILQGIAKRLELTRMKEQQQQQQHIVMHA